MKKINIALIDSGTKLKCTENIKIEIINNKVEITPQEKVIHLHGDVLANIIDDSFVNIYDIQIFNENLTCSPQHIFEALKYLEKKDIDIISMSLGFTTNYKEIAESCNRLLKKGTFIVSSYPREGQKAVYPACYDGVIRVTADGRCIDDEIAVIDDNFYATNPHSDIEQIAGSSVSVAKFTKVFSKYLHEGLTKTEISKRIEDAYQPR